MRSADDFEYMVLKAPNEDELGHVLSEAALLLWEPVSYAVDARREHFVLCRRSVTEFEEKESSIRSSLESGRYDGDAQKKRMMQDWLAKGRKQSLDTKEWLALTLGGAEV